MLLMPTCSPEFTSSNAARHPGPFCLTPQGLDIRDAGLLYGEGCLYDSVLLKDTRGRQLRGLGPPAVREGKERRAGWPLSPSSASKLQDSGSQGSQLKLKHKDQEQGERGGGKGKAPDPG